MKLPEMRDKLAEIREGSQAIIKKAEVEERDLTEDEAATIDSMHEQFARLEANVKRCQLAQDLDHRLSAVQPRRTQVADIEPAENDRAAGAQLSRSVAGPLTRADVIRNRGTWDWGDFGEFARAVCHHCRPGGATDPRLTARMAPTTVGSEGVGADGGFAVPPDFRAEIEQLVRGEDSLVTRCDQLTTSSNSLSIPKDATTPWQTSGGILAYWDGENQQLTQSKPNLTREVVPVDKLTCLVPVTDELLDDAPALDSYLRRKAPQKMTFKANLAIIQGTGVGQPTGILNSGSLVSVAKETSQAADTIVSDNVFKMYSRMYGPSRANAIWLINQDVEPQLFKMTVNVLNVAGTENVGGSAVYVPPGGMSAAPYGTLLGRPVVPTQACETLGDKGDIIFADLTQYMLIQKTGGIRSEVSIHLWFDYDTTAFRFIWRLGGRPWWDAYISARDGSNTMSPFVTLDERGT